MFENPSYQARASEFENTCKKIEWLAVPEPFVIIVNALEDQEFALQKPELANRDDGSAFPTDLAWNLNCEWAGFQNWCEKWSLWKEQDQLMDIRVLPASLICFSNLLDTGLAFLTMLIDFLDEMNCFVQLNNQCGTNWQYQVCYLFGDIIAVIDPTLSCASYLYVGSNNRKWMEGARIDDNGYIRLINNHSIISYSIDQ